jgi:hypothetical protein
MPTTASLPCSETTVTLTARLDIENLISLFALGEDDPAFTVIRYRFSGAEFG